MKASQTKRVAFIDLDGTLLGPDRQVGPENLAALDRLREAGIEIVIASGRHHRNILGFEQIVGTSWVVSSQGAMVRHRETGEIVMEMTLTPERVAEACRRARAEGMTVIAYHREGAHIEEISEWSELYARKAGWTPQVGSFGNLSPDGFQKILWSEAPARIDAIAPVLRRDLAGHYDMVVTEPELLEFLTPGANKAAGAQALADRLGLRRENAFAFGDGNNDVELLGWAGISVAMEHGRESARRAAHFVSPPGPPESAFARAVDLALSV